MAQLHIIDPQQIEYENDLLKLTILGGVKLEGLDRLRVTLRIEINNSRLGSWHTKRNKFHQCFLTQLWLYPSNKVYLVQMPVL
ncbi:MAG: hypothetical protein E6Q58_04145 [Niabella sp.]|nr:MAG: hypothetical protein E6Q58_04145 [Niabella sp.]